MKYHFLILFGACTFFILPRSTAQDCGEMLANARAALRRDAFDKALKDLQALENCDIADVLKKERQTLQLSIFNAINQRMVEAEAAKQKSVEAQDSLQTVYENLKSVSQRLDSAWIDQVKLLLDKADQNIATRNFAAAADNLNTAKLLRAMPEKVNETYQRLCAALLSDAGASLDAAKTDHGAALSALTVAATIALEVENAPFKTSVSALQGNLKSSLLQAVSQEILNANYATATEKARMAISAGVSKDTLTDLLFEIAFCLNETGRPDSAMVLIDILAQWIYPAGWQYQGKQPDVQVPELKTTWLRSAFHQLDPPRAARMTARYFPRLVDIPGGTIRMGQAPDEQPGAEKGCPVQVKPFRMAAKELSFYEYDLYCEATGYPKTPDFGWGRGERPVVGITWYEAILYCNWRSELESQWTPAYVIQGTDGKSAGPAGGTAFSATPVKGMGQEVTPVKGKTRGSGDFAAGTGYRLPTEAEWEFAAGNGEKHTKYSWGNALPGEQLAGNLCDTLALAHFPEWTAAPVSSDHFPFTAPAGSYPPNTFGLYDMSGNVWEWCTNFYFDHYCETINKEKRSSKKRAVRGGSWGSYPDDCLVRRSFGLSPGTGNWTTGFRLAQSRE